MRDATRIDPPASSPLAAGPAREQLAVSLAVAAAVIFAMGGRALLGSALASHLPFLLAFPAVALMAWQAGGGAGVAVALGCVAWMISPLPPSADTPLDAARQSALFLPTAVVLAVFCGGLSAARREAAGGDLVEGRAQRSNLRWLRLAMVAALVVPIGVLVAVGTYLYEQTAADADLRLDRAARVAEEHAQKIFGTNMVVLNETLEALGDDDDSVVLAREEALHQRLTRMATVAPQVQSIWIFDARGRPLVSNRYYPAPRERLDVSDRAYFRWHRDKRGGVYFTEALQGKVTRDVFFDMSRRRERADGRFAGVVSVSLFPGYFNDFYRELAAAEPGLVITLMRDDGSVLARWPAVEAGRQQATDGPLMATIRRAPLVGKLSGVSPIDGVDRLWSYRQVRGYPVYVAAAMDRASVRERWSDPLALLAAFTVPIALALAFMSWLALRRTSDEVDALARLRGEQAQRQRAEEALRQSQKLEAMGRLTGGVAHDINNLLMVVGNNLYLHKRLLPQAADSAQLGAIERAIAAGAKLTRQLLSFSRRQALHPEVIRLQDRMPALLDLVRPVLGAGVQLDSVVEPDTPPIEVDPAELELALINLAVNARDAMASGGRLAVRAGRAEGGAPGLAGDFVCLSVADTGQGIDPRLVERVFEPFFTTKPPGMGTGLGLSQVYGLCSRGGGTVTVHSQVGSGTRFDLFFPVASRPAPPTVLAGDAAGQAPMRCKVLLVEDNAEVALATVPLLESLGCEVERVGSGDAARQRLAGAAGVDLVLSDIAMPGETDGIELAAWLRRAHPDLPVLLMTGYTRQLEQALRQGFEVLQKPVSPDLLAQALREALSAARGPASGAGG